jgi:hypothetical protein
MPESDPSPRLRTVTVRFPGPAHAVIEEAARAEGVSFAAYVREAALMRWAYYLGREHAAQRGEEAYLDAGTLDAIVSEIKRALGP